MRGDLLARTPNLDELAARGIIFDAHYCASPICTPTRQTFTTGKHVSRHSVWSNTHGVPEGTPTLARQLNSAGYESYLIGKMHYKGGMTHGYSVIDEKTGKIRPAHEVRPSTDVAATAQAASSPARGRVPGERRRARRRID